MVRWAPRSEYGRRRANPRQAGWAPKSKTTDSGRAAKPSPDGGAIGEAVRIAAMGRSLFGRASLGELLDRLLKATDSAAPPSLLSIRIYAEKEAHPYPSADWPLTVELNRFAVSVFDQLH